MKVIAFCNQKGGVGKTTSAHALLAGLKLKHKKVLAIDADPQENLCMAMGVNLTAADPDQVENEQLKAKMKRLGKTDEEIRNYIYELRERAPKTLYDLMSVEARIQSGSLSEDDNIPLERAIVKTESGIDLILSGASLVSADMEFASVVKREYIFKSVIQRIKDNCDYDYVIIDCNPSLGILLMNVLTATDEVIIPISPSRFAIHGVSRLYTFISAIRKNTNPSLQIAGILITMTKNTSNGAVMAEEIANLHNSQFLEYINVYKTQIRTNVTLDEAQTLSTDIFSLDPKSNGAKDYRAFVNEFLKGEN